MAYELISSQTEWGLSKVMQQWLESLSFYSNFRYFWLSAFPYYRKPLSVYSIFISLVLRQCEIVALKILV